jgi:hypothetical protein
MPAPVFRAPLALPVFWRTKPGPGGVHPRARSLGGRTGRASGTRKNGQHPCESRTVEQQRVVGTACHVECVRWYWCPSSCLDWHVSSYSFLGPRRVSAWVVLAIGRASSRTSSLPPDGHGLERGPGRLQRGRPRRRGRERADLRPGRARHVAALSAAWRAWRSCPRGARGRRDLRAPRCSRSTRAQADTPRGSHPARRRTVPTRA